MKPETIEKITRYVGYALVIFITIAGIWVMFSSG